MSSEFEGAGKKPGVEVWRIEKMVPTPVPLKMYGQFYDGDAYIVCKTTQRPNSSSFDIDIHFWLGEDCSKDEMGVAAYKTVELDEYLGGGPVQHRELQGVESEKFMSVFKKVEYLKGGVASGFKHVERDSHEPRLLHIKGNRSVRVAQVAMASASLNSGDVFVLDLGTKLIQWNGAECNRKEKAKALDVCVGIKDDERGGKCAVDACDQGSEPAEFWTALGGQGPVAPATDDAAATAEMGIAKLLKVSDATGAMSTAEVASGELKREMLDTKDVFIMDNVAEVFVWIGKEASPEERKKGMSVASDYCEQAGRAKTTKVSKVMEGCEPAVFKSNFVTWQQPAAMMPMNTPRGGNVAASGQRDRSASQLMGDMDDQARAEKENEAMVDSGNGTIDVFRIEGFEVVKVDESLEGVFYAGDSYIVKYVPRTAHPPSTAAPRTPCALSSLHTPCALSSLRTCCVSHLAGTSTRRTARSCASFTFGLAATHRRTSAARAPSRRPKWTTTWAACPPRSALPRARSRSTLSAASRVGWSSTRAARRAASRTVPTRTSTTRTASRSSMCAARAPTIRARCRWRRRRPRSTAATASCCSPPPRSSCGRARAPTTLSSRRRRPPRRR